MTRLTQVPNRLGSVSKTLTAIGALRVPFVVTAGVHGMNFTDSKLAALPHGFVVMAGVQLLLALRALRAMLAIVLLVGRR